MKKSFSFKDFKYKNLSIILVIALLMLITIFGLRSYYYEKSVSVDSLEIVLYKAKGTRDENKIEVDSYAMNDFKLIQMAYETEGAESKIKFLLKSEMKEGNKDIFTVEIPIKDDAKKYVNLPHLEKGKYIIFISENEKEIKNKKFEVK